jgi:hypothetical protein
MIVSDYGDFFLTSLKKISSSSTTAKKKQIPFQNSSSFLDYPLKTV